MKTKLEKVISHLKIHDLMKFIDILICCADK